jgi:hypothetical protein
MDWKLVLAFLLWLFPSPLPQSLWTDLATVIAQDNGPPRSVGDDFYMTTFEHMNVSDCNRTVTVMNTSLTPGTGSLVLLGGSVRLELHASGTLV